MNKLEANINIKCFEEFKVSHDILCKMLQDKNINVSIRLKYMREFNNKIEKENNMNKFNWDLINQPNTVVHCKTRQY